MAWLKGRPRSPEEKERIRQGKLGKVPSQKHREAISDGVRRWWQRRKEQQEQAGQD